MTRNLNRRVELLFPVLQEDLAERVSRIYQTMWTDNVKTRVLQPDDTYLHVDRRGRPALDAQTLFTQQATERAEAQKATERRSPTNEFQPMLSPENQPTTLDDGSDTN